MNINVLTETITLWCKRKIFRNVSLFTENVNFVLRSKNHFAGYIAAAVNVFTKMNASEHIRSDVYDFDSVMHYGSYRFRTNQDGPAMLFKNGSLIPELQTKTQLSDLDIVGLNLLYECSSANSYFIRTSNWYVVAILWAAIYFFQTSVKVIF